MKKQQIMSINTYLMISSTFTCLITIAKIIIALAIVWFFDISISNVDISFYTWLTEKGLMCAIGFAPYYFYNAKHIGQVNASLKEELLKQGYN